MEVSNWVKRTAGSSNVWIALGITALFFLLEGWRGLNLWDEGFLWYGTQRVLAGEVPIRDFYSYDPGRYYIMALVMRLLGNDGVVALRFALALVQVVGITAGLWALSRQHSGRGWGEIGWKVLYALIIILWMIPRHKMVDMSISLVLVALLTWLQEKPSQKRFFLAGVAIGVIAFMGRNHGVYGLFGLVCTTLWIHYTEGSWKAIFQRGLVAGSGIVVGYLPMLGMLAFVPGFWEVFFSDVVELVIWGNTNWSKPVPWPWLVPHSSLSSLFGLGNLFVGIFFILLLIFPLVIVGYYLLRKKTGYIVHPILVAAIFLSLPYTHFAFSRPGLGHLAQGIFPMLIGLQYLVGRLVPVGRSLGLALLAVMVLMVSILGRPLPTFANFRWKKVEVAGDFLLVDPGVLSQIKLLELLVDKYAPGDRSVVILPFLPGAYSILGKKCPTWLNFVRFPLTKAKQQKEIERIKAASPGFIWIDNNALDGIQDRNFGNLNAFLFEYIQTNYKEIEENQPENVRLFVPY